MPTQTTTVTPAKYTLGDNPPATPTLEAYVVIDVNGTQFTLSGTAGTNVIVEYHETFENSINLGPILSIVGAVGTALGAGADFATDITKKVNDFAASTVPLLASVVKAVTTANVRITDLGINTATGVYQFGFALDFTGQGIAIGNMQLDAFGLRFTHTATKS